MRRSPLTYIVLGFSLLLGCSEERSNPYGSGMVEATEIVVSAETPGQVMMLFFDEGDSIDRGDTIAIIDTTTLSLRSRQGKTAIDAAEEQVRTADLNIRQARVNLQLAEKEYNRAKTLIKTGSVNQQQYDEVETAYERARLARDQAGVQKKAAEADLARLQAELAIIEKQLNDCFPVSPATGIVTDKYVEAGELAAVGRPLVEIARMDTVWVKIYLPPADLTKIKLEDRAEIDPEDGRKKPLEGRVTWISSQAEFTPKNVQTKEARADLVYAVKITIPNKEQVLKIGMPVFVTIP